MVLQVGAGKSVERGEWLVEQQHFRPRHQRPRNGDALRLAAGQFARPHGGLVGEPDALERGGDALRALALRPVAEPEADIVGDLEPGQQPRLLEDDADLFVRRRDRLAVEHDRAFARRIESADGAQQRRFSAARAADHGDDLAELDFERYAAERMHAVRIGFADAFEDEHCYCLRFPDAVQREAVHR